MEERIVIQGDTATLERTEILKVGKTEEFLQKLAQQETVDTGLLPKHCAMYNVRGGITNYLLFQQAQIRKLKHEAFPDGVEVALPSMIYKFPIQNGQIQSSASKVGFVKELHPGGLTSESAVWMPWLPNHYSGSLAICGGSGYEQVCGMRGLNNAERVERAFDVLQLATYNNDLSYFMHAGVQPASIRELPEDSLEPHKPSEGALLAYYQAGNHVREDSAYWLMYLHVVTQYLRSRDTGDVGACQFMRDALDEASRAEPITFGAFFGA